MAVPSGSYGRMPEVTGFLARLRVEKAASAHTLRSYQLDLEQFLSWLAKGQAPPSPDTVRSLSVSDLAKVTHLTAREFLVYLQRQELSRRTVARKLSCLRSFFRYLCAVGFLDVNPLAGLRPPKSEPLSPAVLQEGEVALLLSAPDPTGPLGLRDRALLELLYATGLRVGELVVLDRGDLDLAGGWLTVRGGGRRERTVPVGAAALAALQVYLTTGFPQLAEGAQTAPAGQPLFLNHRGKRLTDRSVRRILDGYMHQAVPAGHANPRLLRHSVAAHMLAAGADPAVVQSMLGHASPAPFQGLTLALPGRLREAYQGAHPRERAARERHAQAEIRLRENPDD